MPELDNKVALITGASRGIGRATALVFAGNGAKVICASRSIRALKSVVKEIEAAGGAAMAVRLDVSELSAFQACVKKAVKAFDTIHILVNNAGIVRDKLILRMSEKDWDDVIDINLKGCFNGIKAVTPLMVKNKYGRIINITSVVGISGNAGQANYAASKAGIIGLTKSVAKELASRNVTVNSIAPGFIETELTNDLPDTVKEELIRQIPLRRIGRPDEVANLALYLASDKAGYMTGETVLINGGLHM